METKMEPGRKLSRVKINLLRNPKTALMSGILMVGKTSLDDDVPTAATNGRDERYNPNFVSRLSEKELAFVIMHESCHKMYRHLTTWKKLYDEHPRLANAACDYVINLMLRELDPTESFMAMPRKPDGSLLGLLDVRFKGMNAKQVYDILKQEQKDKGGDGEDGGEDVHGQPGGPGENPDGFDDHDWNGAQRSEEEQKELEREIDQAIRQGLINDEKMNGKGAGSLARELGDLLRPKVDWREQLREYVKSICAGKDTSTWRKPNRRFLHLGIYMPTLVSERVHHICAAVDTSGSIGGPELNAFLSEFVAICEQVSPEKIDLIYWDSHVAGHEEYEGADASNIVSSTKPVGGGGTSPSCVTAYLKEKRLTPDVTVVLTDGYVGSDWGGEWDHPVLWCIVGGNDVVSPVGKTVHVNDD